MELHLSSVVALVVAATALAIAAKRARIPYNVMLVVGGLLIALSGLVPSAPPLEPAVVFLVCLPALLFEGGVTTDLETIRADAVPITMLAIVGMVIAIGVSGFAFHYALAIPLGAGLILGAILAGTDTVSVLFAFRRVPVPPRLAGIMEGETLFNDGTALVAYGTIVAAVTSGRAATLPTVGASMFLAVIGGIAVGLALGLTAAFVLRRADDPLAEIMATTALAYAAYAVGEALHVSGVIAVVVAALVIGQNIRAHSPPTSRIAIDSFWHYIAFGVNTFLFLSIGLATSFDSLLRHMLETLIAVACLFAGRAAAVYGTFFLLGKLRPVARVPLRWQHVFVIGNIKGAISVALALGLPASTPHRELLVNVAFGVTFVSLLAQGLLLGKSLVWLGLAAEDPEAALFAEQQALLITGRAAQQELEVLRASGSLSRAEYERLRSEYQVTIASAERELRRLGDRHLALGAQAILRARRRLIDAERSALGAARRSGLIPEATEDRMRTTIDRRLLALERALAGDHVEPGSEEHRREGAQS